MMEILACPVCRGGLELHIEAEDAAEVISGRLHCAVCPESYPIEDTIPNLLPPDLRRELA